MSKSTLTMEKLEEYAKYCLKNNTPLMLLIDLPGLNSPELIINPVENIEEKMKYYRETYDDNCQHKFSNGVAIVDVVVEDSRDIGWAVEKLKEGKKVKLPGSDAYLTLYSHLFNTPVILINIGEIRKPWVPVGELILRNDWEVLEED